jgi:hypothetical protein
MAVRISQTVNVGGGAGAGAGGGPGPGLLGAVVVGAAVVLLLGAVAAALGAAVAAVAAIVKLIFLALAGAVGLAGFAAGGLLAYRFRRPIGAYARWAVAPRARQAVVTVQRDGLPWVRVHQITGAPPALPSPGRREVTPARR